MWICPSCRKEQDRRGNICIYCNTYYRTDCILLYTDLWETLQKICVESINQDNIRVTCNKDMLLDYPLVLYGKRAEVEQLLEQLLIKKCDEVLELTRLFWR